MRVYNLQLILLFACFLNSVGHSAPPALEEAKTLGAKNSSYLTQRPLPQSTEAPVANLKHYKREIQPLLEEACFSCHGPDVQEREFRVDTLDPDLINGQDAGWWVEVFDVISKGEMPPPDQVEFSGEDKRTIVDWLSHELQVVSQVQRREGGHSSFRRMTRYEYNYALQDLLGLPYNFVRDLPPEASSEDGFLNSSEMLQVSASQLETYRVIARNALRAATIRGEKPKPVYFDIRMDFDSAKAESELAKDLEKIRQQFADDPEKQSEKITERRNKKPRGAYFQNQKTGLATEAKWSYGGAKYARSPVDEKPTVPPQLENIAVIPAGQRLIIDVGDHLPDTGPMRMRIRAKATTPNTDWVPTLRVCFGHQASNDSRVEEVVGHFALNATADNSEIYEFQIQLSEVVRNAYRGSQKLGQLPNPAEYIKFQNISERAIDIQIDFIEIVAPYYVEWPPQSHRRVFAESDDRKNLKRFMFMAWRRPPTNAELDQKLKLYEVLRPMCADSQAAMIEVLAGVLASPKFLYVNSPHASAEFRLATRLSLFLWSSLPDERLLDLAERGELSKPETLIAETERLLDNPRAQRFSQHFVRQWLGMQLLDHAQVNEELRKAMSQEPIEFFAEVLQRNGSILDFLHTDYTLLNATLAQHYGLPDVHGKEFRRVELHPDLQRGGLLTQAGLLAMNSDGKHSHPLKRGIWLLESILNDPPPPPPPAVPEIDLADPEILKLTLKERMEDHRNDPACMSCHQKIDPWGIAFENFDAQGRWRKSIDGKPVDASSRLFNNQELNGIDGLKHFLLANRQDQFARAMTHKLLTYALGRPLSFADRADVEELTAKLRQQDDGLRTLIQLIALSDLFQES